jgi:putative phage-type endonuclease
MKKIKGLVLIPTKGMTREQWLTARKDGIGGSDISSILGLNKNFPAIDLFYQKIGLIENSTEENDAMFWGSELEDQVLEKAQYYDIDTASYRDNFHSGRILRRISKVKYMIRNEKYPHILANIDGAVNFQPRSFRMDAIAEAKCISRQTAEMWENGLPPYHIIQIQTYATVCAPLMRGKPEAFIFYLEDGRTFRGYQIPVFENIQEQIINRSADFWERVVKGREIIATVKDNTKRMQFLSQIEPEPDTTKAYEQFLSELFKLKSEMITVQGSDEVFEAASAYNIFKAEVNALEEKAQAERNKILQFMHHNNANIISFGDNGTIKYNKRLYVNIK